MRIDAVETFVVGNPPPSFGGQYFVFVKLTTDDGIVGYGEAYGATFRPQVVAAAIEDLADHFLVGEDPHHIERFWRRAYSRGFTQRPDVTLSGCVSALEMACWDIIGKAADRPVYELLGGRVHESLRSYTYLYPRPDDTADVYADATAAAARAVDEVERGFDAVKFDPSGPYTAMGGHQPRLVDVERTVAFVREIRAAVGNRADLLVGTHGQFTAGGALRIAREIAPYDPLWFEEPVPPDDVGAMAQVAAQSSVPIATGERLTTKYEFARVLEARAASIIQLNLGRAGGLLEGKKIAALAEAFGAQIAPHCYNGPIGLAANMQLATCSPNFLIIESIMDNSGFHADLLTSPIQWEAGRLIPSTAPGIGVELDESFARAHPYTGDRTHLSMWNDPIDTAGDVVR
ncbi:MAG: mandelate racemase/muconate lactonizing enzyme family protein [Ilumatobacteraceae bacterium]|nr:mandelate racemase/muconate lactonizing enzyme family protein [Ilumatobacteraceae bacterium]